MLHYNRVYFQPLYFPNWPGAVQFDITWYRYNDTRRPCFWTFIFNMLQPDFTLKVLNNLN